MTTNYADQLDKAEAALIRRKEILALEIGNSLALGGEDLSSDRMASMVNDIAESEGEIRVLTLLANAEERGKSKEEIKEALFRLALRGPDDAWSGRGNDVRRALADGIRSAIDDAMWDLH